MLAGALPPDETSKKSAPAARAQPATVTTSSIVRPPSVQSVPE
ncbi:MAG: hypothetical protein QOE37_985, partial [Microbacteriaceae bacterium]|nr:hypothetical protein [Microbacteriaceae bacterium]